MLLLCRIMNDARTWLIKLPSMSNPKVAFKKLRDFSNQGNRLGVDLPEVAELRRSIRIREYEDATRKASCQSNLSDVVLA